MTLYGTGRAAIADDAETAERLGWPRRRRGAAEPEIVLHRRSGDPRREPWITPPGWRRSVGPSALWGEGQRSPGWQYLATPEGVLRPLRRLAAPPPSRRCVGIAGLGRVGGTAVTVLAALPAARTGISTLLITDADNGNLRRWQAELGSIVEWQRAGRLPTVEAVEAEEMLRRCDAFLFAASAGVPPLGSEGDVRHVQLDANRELLRSYLGVAARVGFDGLFLIVSDPVESLAAVAFAESNRDPAGRFTGSGLAPERIAGLALGVMWGRALATARREGWDTVARRGGAYGPHSDEVVIFDDLRRPDAARSAVLSHAARSGNLELRAMGYLPYVGPAVSSVALALPRLLAGREAPASVFLDGVYLGAPAIAPFGVHPVARRLGREVRDSLTRVFEQQRSRVAALGALPHASGARAGARRA